MRATHTRNMGGHLIAGKALEGGVQTMYTGSKTGEFFMN